MPAPRIDRAEVSPIVQRSASSRLDLPQPFGPTIPVSPGSMRRSAASTKLLKPDSLKPLDLHLVTAPRLRAARQAPAAFSCGSSVAQSLVFGSALPLMMKVGVPETLNWLFAFSVFLVSVDRLPGR